MFSILPTSAESCAVFCCVSNASLVVVTSLTGIKLADKNAAVSLPDNPYKNLQVYPSKVLNGFGDVPVGLTVDLFIVPVPLLLCCKQI